MLTLAPGIAIGVGLVLILSTALPRRTALRDALAAPYRSPEPTSQPSVESSPLVRAGSKAIPLLKACGLPRPGRLRDLRLLDRSPEEHLATQAACAGAFLLLGALYPAALRVAGIAAFPTPTMICALVLCGAGGFLYPEHKVHAEAEEVRDHLRHATNAFLGLVSLMLAAGAGLEEALISAAEPGFGAGHDHLRTALAVAQTSRKPLWETLGQLGEHAGVTELSELAACAAVAGSEGAQIRTTLTTKAKSLRNRLLAEQEAKAVTATERTALPTGLLMIGYVLLVTFPAVTQAVHSL